jgi:hypothetical protein
MGGRTDPLCDMDRLTGCMSSGVSARFVFPVMWLIVADVSAQGGLKLLTSDLYILFISYLSLFNILLIYFPI